MRHWPVAHCAIVLAVALAHGSPQPPQSVLEVWVSTHAPPQQAPCVHVLAEQVPPSALSQVWLPGVLWQVVPAMQPPLAVAHSSTSTQAVAPVPV
jgi:hypothetical protein